MKKKLRIFRFVHLLLGLFAFLTASAQTNCYMQISSTSSAALCPGSPIVLSANTAAVNVGTGVTGTLNATTTVYTDAIRAAIISANNSGTNRKVRVASVVGFSAGDEVLLITMQDPNTAASNLVGQYEYVKISTISLDTLIFTTVLSNNYNASGSIKHQAIKVPHYTNVTIASGGVLTCNSWDGSTGGVLAFRASGAVTISAGGSINANGKGYRTVPQKAALWRNANGAQGEGIYGTGIGSGVNGAGPCNNNAAWNNANGNGGGGGTGCGDSGGGGGGGYATAGTIGVNSGHTPGNGGNAVGNSSVTLLYMGGAGGEGGADEDGAYSGTGGNGGGIIFISTSSLAVNGSLQCNGNIGSNASNGAPGGGCGSTAGGGGAGGSIVLQMNSFSGTGSNIVSTGGTGGLSVGGCNSGAATGGAGSNGRIRVEIQSGSVSTNPASYQVTLPNPTGLAYLWSTASTQTSTSVSPLISSVYNVTITAGSSCVGTTASFTVPVLSTPTISITGTSSVCAGGTVTLTANGASTYTWLNNNTNGTSLSINPSANTIYTLSGKSAQGCDGNAATLAVNVYSVPVISVSGINSICAGQSTSLSASGAANYTWLNPSSSNATVNVSPSVNSTYSVSGNSTQGCSGNIATMAVAVNTVPILSISGSNSLCVGQSLVLTGSGANTYTWINTNTNGSTVSINPSSNTTFSLNGTSLAGCVGSISTLAVSAYSLPVILITGTNAICAGGNSTLSASGANTYTWVAPSSNNTVLTVSPIAATIYTVNGKSQFGCAGNSATLAVSVYSLPIVSISGNSSVCAGSTVALTGAGASNYTWTNASSTSSLITVSPSSTTTYSLIGKTSQGCLGNTATQAVSVYSLPIVSITGTNALCAGGSTSLSANGASTYTWINSSSNANSITVSPASTTSYSLVGSSSQGCAGAAAILAVNVYSLPVIAITGSNAICAGGTTNLTANGASTYTWINNASNSTNISVSPSALTDYTLTGRSIQGCLGNTATLSVNVYSLPVLGITGSNTLCAGGLLSLNANGAATYTWVNSGSNANSQNVSPSSSITYSLIGRSANGCLGNTATLAAVVYTSPAISVSGNLVICEGASTTLSVTGANTYTWTDSGSNASVISVSPSVTTSYSVMGSNAQGCSSNISTTTVVVNPLPLLAISGPTNICAGDVLSLNASGAATFTWLNTNSNAVNLNDSPSAAVIYTLAGTSAQSCEGSVATLAVSVYSLPILNISGSNTLCAGSTVVLSAGGASTYTWLNTNSSATVESVSPIINTTYSLMGTSSDGCVGNTATVATVVYTLPIVSITGSTVSCAGGVAMLSANGANSYTWANSNANSNTISISPIASTIYSLTGESSDGCVGNMATLAFVVNPNPTLNIAGSNTICEGDGSTLTASGADTYSWSTGSSVAAVAVSPTVTMSYSVVGTFSTGCESSESITLTVNSNPTVVISGNNSICAGDTAILNAAGAATYLWDTNDQTASISVSPNTNTSYTVIGMDANGCSATAVQALTVNALPILVLSGNSAICAGDSVFVSVTGANSYTWNTGTNASGVMLTPTVSAGYATFGITGLSVEGCVSMLNDSVLVNPVPSLTLSGGSFVCNGGSLMLSIMGADSYLWSTGSTSNTILVSPSNDTTYTVIGTNLFGCSIVAANNVSVVAFPAVAISGNTVICSGDSLSLTASGANTYTWSTGTTNSLVVVSPSTTTSYTLIGEVGVGCSDTVQQVIVVNAIPELSLSISSLTICNGENVEITASGASTYLWNDGSNGSTISVSPSVNTNYTVVGTSSDNCSSQSIVQLEVSDCAGISKQKGNEGLKVYPNPVSGWLQINLGNSDLCQLEVLNTIGQIVLSQKISEKGYLDLKQFDNGLYFIRVKHENGQVETKSIIKQ